EVSSGKHRAVPIDDRPTCQALSPDGTVLAWGSYVPKDQQVAATMIRRRDLTTGKDLPAVPGGAAKAIVHLLAFAPDGRTLAAASHQGNVSLWDMPNAQLRAMLKPEDGRRIMALTFSPDGRTLAVGLGGRDHEPGSIVLWDAPTGRRREVLTGHTNAVWSV